MKDMFRKFLDQKGISSSFVDSNQTLMQFSYDGINFLFEYDLVEDPLYIRILIPKIGEIEENGLQILHDMTKTYKVGKAFTVNGEVWFSADAFIYNESGCELLFERLLLVLKDMFIEYKKKKRRNG